MHLVWFILISNAARETQAPCYCTVVRTLSFVRDFLQEINDIVARCQVLLPNSQTLPDLDRQGSLFDTGLTGHWEFSLETAGCVVKPRHLFETGGNTETGGFSQCVHQWLLQVPPQ